MPPVDLICLANSYKWGHRCIAGLRVDGGGWIRPVSEREHGELGWRHYRLPDWSEPRLLDAIRVGLSNPEPLPWQPENWRIDGSAWKLIERPAPAEQAPVVAGAVSRSPLLLGTAGSSVQEAQCLRRPAGESLVLVQPSDIRWCSEFDPHEQHNRARVLFRLDQLLYDLPLTDPSYVGRLTRHQPGHYRSSEVGIPPERRILFTIGLGEPLDGVCYKLVVAVLAVPRSWDAFFLTPPSAPESPARSASS